MSLTGFAPLALAASLALACGEGWIIARQHDALTVQRRALAEALTHTRQRRMFGGTLADFQLTQAALADMATQIDAAALLTYRAAWLRDTGEPVS